MTESFWLEALKVGGPVLATLLGAGYIIITMTKTHSRFIADMQSKWQENQRDLMNFAKDTSTIAQAGTDTLSHLSQGIDRQCVLLDDLKQLINTKIKD